MVRPFRAISADIARNANL